MTEKCQQRKSPIYSMTASARASSGAKILNPERLGYFEIDREVGLCRLFDGQIPGSAPFRMRST
jgi:hypothetical protein